jgi:hypothetical protein
MKKEQSRLKYRPGVLIGTWAKSYGHHSGGNCPNGFPVPTGDPGISVWGENSGCWPLVAHRIVCQGSLSGACYLPLGRVRYMAASG